MSKLNLATKAEILGIDDLPTEDIYIPEWDLTVRVRAMDALTWVQAVTMINRLPEGQTRSVMVAYGVVDENGELLFELEDIQALARKNFQPIKRISDAVYRLNRGSEADSEELAENLSDPQTGGSPSD